ncbi:MAG: hypothetical protein QM736_14820 [Vicinamibacterales bacterium]
MLRISSLLPILLILASGFACAAGPALPAAQAGPALLHIDGEPVFAAELDFWLRNVGKYYLASRKLERIDDWSAQQNGMPLREYLVSSAVEYVRRDRVIEAQAASRGIRLGADQELDILNARTEQMRIYGSDAEYGRVVASMYGSEALFDYLTRIELLGDAVFADLFGAGGERCDDDCVTAYAAREHLMPARTLHFAAKDPANRTLSAGERRANRRKLHAVLARLRADPSPAAAFAAEANDGGPQFALAQSDARLPVVLERLKPGEISGVISTDQGDWLILRMAIDPAMPVDAAGHSLRRQAAYDSLFKPWVLDRARAQSIERLPALGQLDVPGLLAETSR